MSPKEKESKTPVSVGASDGFDQDDVMPLSRQKVLIVDDSPTNIHALYAILSTEHEVLFATNGEEALEVAARERPDLVLLDVVMPGLNGYQVLAALKREPATSQIPVIFVTAMGDIEDEAKGLSMGAIDYIIKPFSPGIVRIRVNNQLELKRHRDLLRELSTRDGLTGIANRRAFDEKLQQEWQRGMRSQSSLALVMIDVDHFKAFNDRYGHTDGDDCLRRVARALTVVPMRAADLVARMGGEEFGCILPDTDEIGARKVAEEMRLQIASLAYPHVDGEGGIVTISLGTAVCQPALDDDPDALLRRADAALYRAKHGGRNRVEA